MSKQPYFNASAIKSAFWLCCSIVVAYTFWASMTPLQAAQSQFRLQTATVAVAAGKSQSSSFALDSCIDQFMAANSKSSSFRLQSGCGTAQASTSSAITGGPNGSEEAIPLLSLWSTATLTLLILLVSSLYLRSGRQPTF